MLRLRLTAFASALLASFVLAGPAHASHYFLQDISERFTPVMIEEFARFNLQTTEDLLRNIASLEDRNNFADVTGVPLAELTEIARLCDFLQIDGVGPKAAELLMATGVTTVRDLAGRDAATLTAEIEVVNQTARITGVNPEVYHVTGWIEGAASVPIQVDL